MSKGDGGTKGSGGDGDSIQVYARVRPPSREQEIELDLGMCVSVDTTNRAITLKAKPDPKVFTFDHVADPSTTQESVFSAVAKKLIDSCISGYNGTIFAYGQTGSGKTFTMMGPSEDENSFQHELRGVIPRSFEYLFNLINRQKELLGDRIKFLCRASFLEIYNEQLSDLLDTGGASPQLRENIKLGVFVEGLTEQAVNSATDAYQVLQDGWKNRRVAETAMNTESSRSHAVFTLHIESKENKQGTWQVRASRLNLVDLAGSERQKDTKTTGSRLKEGCSINKSLSALGNVIMCLVHNSHDVKPRYVPYRDSKLTFLLRDSLGGNAKTHIIACVHPGNKFFGETLSTLQFARRAKQIKNKAVVNEDLHGNIPALQAEIRRLKDDLATKDKMLIELKDTGVTMPSVGGVASGPWRERFMEAVRLFEALKLKLKLKDQKNALLETQISQKEKKILQTKMVLRFRSETVKHWEAQHKKNPQPDSSDLIMSLREEVRALEEMNSSKHEVALLAAERSALEREVDVLRTQLTLQQSGEEQLMAAYEEAMAEKDPRSQVYTPQNTNPEEPVSTVERQKSQLAKLQAEMETLKRSHSVDQEALKKKIADMESELASTQTARDELEKTLKMTQERCTIERENQEKMHMDTIKTITTPKKAKYQLRSRIIMAPGSGNMPLPASPLFCTPEAVSQTEAEDGFQEEQMPGELYLEQIEGLTNEIQTLQQENKTMAKTIQDYETKSIEVATEQSGLQTRNKSLEQKVAAYEEAMAHHERDLSKTQKELEETLQARQLALDEMTDLRLLSAQMEKNNIEMRTERDQLRQANTTNESKVSSLTYQLEESQRRTDEVTLSLNSTQEDLENRQSELEYLASQQKELESRLHTEISQHSETRQYLQTLQVQLDKETSTVEHLKSQMQQQGSEKEQELVALLGQKEILEKQLTARHSECVSLEEQVQSLIEQLGSAQEQLTLQQRLKRDLEEAMARVSTERNKLRETVKARDQDLEDVQSQLNDLSERLEAEKALHEDELLTLKGEKEFAVATLEQQLGDQNNKMSSLQAQTDLIQDDLEELQVLNEELITQNTNLEAESRQAKNEISKLNDLKSKLSEQITELDSKVALTEEKLTSQQQQYRALLQERDALVTVEDVVTKLQQDHAELQADRDQLYMSHIERDQDLATARQDIFSLSRQLEELNQQLNRQRTVAEQAQSEAELRVAKKEEDIATWKQIAAVGQTVIDQLTKKKSELELFLSQRELDLAEKCQTIQKNKEAIESARNLDLRVEDQNRQISELEHELTDKADQIERMRAVTLSDQEEKSKLTSEIAELKEVHRKVRTERDDLRSRLDRVEVEAAKLAGHNNPNQKIHYVQQLKQENRDLVEEKARMEIRIVRLENKLKDNQNTKGRHLSSKATPQKAAVGNKETPQKAAVSNMGTPQKAAITTGNKGTPHKVAVGTPSKLLGPTVHKGTPGQRKPANGEAKENQQPAQL